MVLPIFYMGQACSGGAYTFYLNAVMFDGSKVSKTGYVILLR